MKKRLLALLLCVCMVLGMVPCGIVFSAKGETTGTLTLDAEGQGYCPVCDNTVKWTAFSGTTDGTGRMGQFNDKNHHHYYLSADVNARNVSAFFINLLNSQMCLHLNGHDLTYGGYIYASNSTLNIMGEGNVTFTDTNTGTGYDQAGLYIAGSTLNLYGGTYGVAENAVTAGKPTLNLYSGKANVYDATVNGPTLVSNGTLTLDETAALENIQVTTTGKLFVKSTWTGEAQVAFEKALVNNVVPTSAGTCDGAFTGTLKMQYGVELKGSADGKLTGSGFNANLALDENSQAKCPVCEQLVTWTAFAGNSAGTQRLGQINDKGHHHYYLSADVNARNVSQFFINLLNSKLCLHLNGHDLEYGGYIYASNATLNIMGVGSTTFTDTNTASGFDAAGLYINSSTLNLYGGSHGVADMAVTNDKPTILVRYGTANIKGVPVLGRTYVQDNGKLTLEENAQLENIQVTTTGKLILKSSWSGNALVSFDAELVDSKVPAANGSAEAGFTGVLKMADGSKLQTDANGTLIATSLNSALMLDENSQAECPVCEEVVTWTKLENNTRPGYKKEEHFHYYLDGDVKSSIYGQFMELDLGAKMCLHLNGHDLTMTGQCRLWKNTVLSIMGNGNVDYTGDLEREDWKEAMFLGEGGTFNLYGGTYTISGKAIEENRPVILLRRSSHVNLAGAAINGPASVEAGTMTMSGKSNATDLRIGVTGKLTVSKNWTGTANATFYAQLKDGEVPVENGAAEGIYTGALNLPDGSRLFATERGTLRRAITLPLDANSQALCPACNETVSWTALTGNLGSIADGQKHHYYLAADVTCTETLFDLSGNSQLCLHLNGHDLSFGDLTVATDATLYMLGSGSVTGAIQTSGNTNLYGGTYSAQDKQVLSVESGNTTVKNAEVLGQTLVKAGALALAETAVLETIQVEAAGKLTVDQTWAGLAEAAFAVQMVDGAMPEANGASTGDFVGGLSMPDGTRLVGKDNKLVKETTMKLRLTEDGTGYCPVCRALVIWKGVHNGSCIGVLQAATDAKHHYYLADDNMTSAKDKLLVRIVKGNQVCLHLNDKSINVTGAIQIFDGGTLNILGDGHMKFLGNTVSPDANITLIDATSPGTKALNIYGGTYTVPDDKLVLRGNGGNFTVNMIAMLSGNTKLNGKVVLTQSQLHLKDNVSVQYIEGSNTASIRVAENWRGGAVVKYLADQVDTYVSEYNGRADGAFMGGLMLADGRRLIGENGKFRIVESKLMLNAQNEGYCEACNQVVTWTAISGTKSIGYFTDGQHRHYYLSNNLQMPDNGNQLLGLNRTSLCLHLNGYDLTHGGRIFATGKESVLSILGNGNVTFTGNSTAGGDEFRVSAFRPISSATLNILGGTYRVTGKALEENKPILDSTSTGKVLIKNACLNGSATATVGTLILDGTTTVDEIVVNADATLQLADTWSGTASAAFEAPYVGNALPAGKLTSAAYTGTLTLSDGRTVTAGVIAGETVDPNLHYKTTDTGAELVSYTGETDYLLPLSIAGKPVTSIANGAFDNFTGALYIGKDNTVGLAYAKNQSLSYIEASSFTLENGVVQLMENTTALTFNRDTTLDLNGYNLDSVTVTKGTLSVMDSQTDDYTVNDGKGYGKIGNISGKVTAAEGYLQLSDDAGVSFHRVNLDMYAMSLRPSQAGVYYKSYFAGDEIVAAKVQTFGVALSVVAAPDASCMDTHCLYSKFTGFQAGKDANLGRYSTLLKNIIKPNFSDSKNAQRSAIPIYGRAYIKTADGYFFGKTAVRNFQQQIESADTIFEKMSVSQKKAFREMYDTYYTLAENWSLPSVRKYEDMLWFAQPAPDTGDGFEQYALPIGNGYMGVSVFGGTESETLSISDKEMFNPRDDAPSGDGWGGHPPEGPDGEQIMAMSSGGYANMCKAYIDFGHDFDQVTNYQRDLVMKTGQARVHYEYDGVIYNRTYFSSYPDNVTVMKLDASKDGKLTFTLRPQATYVRDYCTLPSDELGKTGTVTASGDTAIVAGTLKGYNINYEAQFKVIPTGGTMRANSDGTITVENADSAVILLSVDTNYELRPETLTAPDNQKLDPNSYPHDKVTAVINAAAKKSYKQLLETYLKDYQDLYCSVDVDLGGTPPTDIPTDQQMAAYREGKSDPYLEELLFQYGRYLLIASSRSGTLPANLQGVWQYYCSAAWGGAYVYNINLQMNYWGCFATNLAELFEPNIEFFDAVWPALQSNADNFLTGVKSPYKEPSGTGANGIAVGAVGNPYKTPVVSTSVSLHSGPGTTAYTSDLFWQYYQFTQDEEMLKENIYPYLEGAATFLAKTLEDYDGKWLVSHSASPENNLYFDDSIATVGTMFDQQMTRESFVQALEAARLLGYTSADSSILAELEEKLDKLDPVNVGKDGHVKEYREEEYYGELGLYEHHGMAQLVGVYPGTTITSQTDAWQDAAAVTAIERGINFTGHQASFKQLMWARLGNAVNSYQVAQEHIIKYIRDNLLNTHSPFQIDGNFGYTAGVAEMLIQSHEGYIKVLPALPKQWNTGSYTGLTARGGFEVDVTWKDGAATKIVITSNAGKPCSLNQFRVSTAKVTDSKGNPVTFTVDNADQITFATVEGGTSTITGLQVKPEVAAAANLAVTEDYDLTWTASPDAVSYNVYRAVNDQATYELIAGNVTATSFSYNPTDLTDGDQLILRVTAVNADGVESEGSRVITWVGDENP